MAQQHAFRGAAQRSEASEEGFFEGSLGSPGPGGYGPLPGTLSSGPGNEAGGQGQRGGLGLSIRIPFGMMGTKLAPSLDAT